MSEKFSLKDHLFNKERVSYLANLIEKVYPGFQSSQFIKKCVEKFPELELKQRIDWMRQKLEEFLPTDFDRALEIILISLPPELDPEKTDDDFGEFILSPFTSFVVARGLSKKHLKKSLDALGEFTKRFSAEDGIRFFINEFPSESFAQIKQWAQSDNYHQRRLATESLRPTLPWNIAINFDYKKGIEVLDLLYTDTTRYVTRSVANHMNDISKIDAELVIDTLKKWKASEKQNSSEMDYIIKHSLRTLLKQGNKEALLLLGYKKPAKVSVECKKISKTVRLGEKLSFYLDIHSHSDQKLLVSYYLYFLNKKNEFIPKVFQIKKIQMNKGQKISITKKHLLREMTTKKLYPGRQAIQIIVNGLTVTDKIFFTLTK